MSITASKGRTGRLARFTPRRWALLWQMQALHLDQRLYQWLRTSSHADEWQARSLWLPDYRVRVEARPLVGVNDNLSGLTWDERRDQLWTVINNPPERLALSRDGELRGRWPLQGFEDVEGIAYLSDNLLLSDESRLVMELNGDGRLVSFSSLQGGFERSVPQAEGMTVDGDGHLYLVSEPNLFYRLSRD